MKDKMLEVYPNLESGMTVCQGIGKMLTLYHKLRGKNRKQC